MNRVREILLYDVRMPLAEPYPTAIATITELNTMVVEARGDDGSIGFGEAAIVEGYTHETRAGGWQFCCEHAERAIGRPLAWVKDDLLRHRAANSHAVTALVSAIDMAGDHPVLRPRETERRIPLLAPVNAKRPDTIAAEVEQRIDAGFRTLKVKVGFDVAADLERVRLVQAAVRGRAHLRLDGNQGYSLAEALAFVGDLSPDGVELLEQPCADHDLQAAAAVARAAPVPTMLDESIYVSEDIDRAAALRAADFIKLKLVKSGGLDALVADLERVRAHGMRRVLGNGVAAEIGCWMEACVAHDYIDNAGELNGFLKPVRRLFANPLPFADGCVVLPPGYVPQIDRPALERCAVQIERIDR